MKVTRGPTTQCIGAILIDAGILSPEDAERALELQRREGLRFGDAAIRLGILSEDDISLALSRQYSYSYLPLSGDSPISPELVTAYQPFSYKAEQFRAIRSQLLLRWFDKVMKRNVLAIVGTGSGEGCTYCAANLAIVFSQLGGRTLLIDADMRAGRQHELFRAPNRVGFSSILAGRVDADSAIFRIPNFDHLFVLPAGPTPPNPQELLWSPVLDAFLQMVREAYDVVLIDTSSTAWGADANVVAVHAGAALAVAHTNGTKMSAFVSLTKALTQSGVPIVGSVLNDPVLLDKVS